MLKVTQPPRTPLQIFRLLKISPLRSGSLLLTLDLYFTWKHSCNASSITQICTHDFRCTYTFPVLFPAVFSHQLIHAWSRYCHPHYHRSGQPTAERVVCWGQVAGEGTSSCSAVLRTSVYWVTGLHSAGASKLLLLLNSMQAQRSSSYLPIYVLHITYKFIYYI